jgi:hypothetical protein
MQTREWRAASLPDRDDQQAPGARSNAKAAVKDRVRRIRPGRRTTRRRGCALDVGGKRRHRTRVQAYRDRRRHARRRLAVGILLAGLAMRGAQVRLRRRIHGDVAEAPVGHGCNWCHDKSHGSPCTTHGRALRSRTGMCDHRHLGEKHHANQQAGDESIHSPGNEHDDSVPWTLKSSMDQATRPVHAATSVRWETDGAPGRLQTSPAHRKVT